MESKSKREPLLRALIAISTRLGQKDVELFIDTLEDLNLSIYIVRHYSQTVKAIRQEKPDIVFILLDKKELAGVMDLICSIRNRFDLEQLDVITIDPDDKSEDEETEDKEDPADMDSEIDILKPQPKSSRIN